MLQRVAGVSNAHADSASAAASCQLCETDMLIRQPCIPSTPWMMKSRSGHERTASMAAVVVVARRGARGDRSGSEGADIERASPCWNFEGA